jgi:hypothetical protein
VHFQLSPLLLIGIVGAVISTVAVIVSAVITSQVGPPPPSGVSGVRPPPPPSMTALIISIGLFVVAWVTVAIAVGRDQLLQKLSAAQAGMTAEFTARLEAVRDQVTHDRSVSLGRIEEKFDTLMREYGETRETEGFLNGMRAATRPPNGDVRPLRTVPPPVER